jgi:triacylglycerol lipase
MLMSVVQIHLSPPNSSLPAQAGRDFSWGTFAKESRASLCIMLFMTNAWLQRFMTLGGSIFCCVLAASLWESQLSWAVVCLAAPLLLTPLMLGIQCIWAAQLNRKETKAHPASLRTWLGAWLSEWHAASKVFAWWQPFRHRAVANNLMATPNQRGMVLVHGFCCNRALWTDWMKQLQAKNRVFVAVDLEPAFGSISDYADTIEAAIAQVSQATGLPPIVVGHSMGGLAIRAWAAKYAREPHQMQRIKRIFTIGTPHHGTAIAAASYSVNGTEMRQKSDWLTSNASCLPNDFATYCTCFFSHCDNIVFPASAATLEGADNQHIAGHAHVQLLFSKDLQQACLSQLEN